MAAKIQNDIISFEKKYGIHFTTKHTGKMAGMASLSTSVVENPICRKRAQIKGSICEKCFAAAMFARYNDTFRDCFKKNTEVLTNQIIPVKEWPIINYRVFRFESFGDLQNATQVHNYFNFAKRNPGTMFALWTKNSEFIAAAIASGNKKPKNMVIIQSSCFINKADTKRYDFIDKVFTVYDKKYIQENNISINCGARNCLECGRCYSKRTGTEVREQLK